MYQRQTYNNANRSVDDNSKSKTIKKNPVEQIFSTVPQLAISSAILFFAVFTHASPFSNLSMLFYISVLSSVIVCAVFFILQLKGAEFKNWEKDKSTRQYIQLATVSSLVSFFGFNISLWSIYGILTPIVIIAAFINILSISTILLLFIK